jgi:hypothetical protein
MRRCEGSEILKDLRSLQIFRFIFQNSIIYADWDICNIHGYNWRHVILSNCIVMENRNLWFIRAFFYLSFVNRFLWRQRPDLFLSLGRFTRSMPCPCRPAKGLGCVFLI